VTELLLQKLPDGRQGVSGGFPVLPGWWNRWDGRDDWFPVGADFAAWVVDELVEGDRLVFVTCPGGM
jgi:hypothetical protein